MPKQTKKYLAAVGTASGLGISIGDDADHLYRELNQKNFFWDSKDGRWVPGSAPEPATALIRIRVWADTDKVGDAANVLTRRLIDSGFNLLEQSQPYMCRPPNQLESRIYLTFIEDS